MDTEAINEILKPHGLTVAEIWRQRSREVNKLRDEKNGIIHEMKFVIVGTPEYKELDCKASEVYKQLIALEQED